MGILVRLSPDEDREVLLEFVPLLFTGDCLLSPSDELSLEFRRTGILLKLSADDDLDLRFDLFSSLWNDDLLEFLSELSLEEDRERSWLPELD